MKQSGQIINKNQGNEKTYTLRKMMHCDIQEILELQERVLNGCSFNSEWFYPFDEEELCEIVGGESIAIGVFVDERLIAFRTGCFSGHEYDEITGVLGGKYKEVPCFLMNGVFVDKDYRGNHLQQKLSDHCVEVCREMGIDTFLSVVHPDNSPSIKSLKSIGFSEVKRQMLFDGRYDRLILVKEIN